jgi:hypothetical protein
MYVIPAFIIGIGISFGVNAIVTNVVIKSFDPDQNIGKVSKVCICKRILFYDYVYIC